MTALANAAASKAQLVVSEDRRVFRLVTLNPFSDTITRPLNRAVELDKQLSLTREVSKKEVKRLTDELVAQKVLVGTHENT